jgi:hypothetical protein
MYSLLFYKVKTKINQIGIEKKKEERKEDGKTERQKKEDGKEDNNTNLSSSSFGGIYIGNDLAENR